MGDVVKFKPRSDIQFIHIPPSAIANVERLPKQERLFRFLLYVPHCSNTISICNEKDEKDTYKFVAAWRQQAFTNLWQWELRYRGLTPHEDNPFKDLETPLKPWGARLLS